MRPCRKECQPLSQAHLYGSISILPFLLLGYRFGAVALWSGGNALDISFCTLLVEAIELETVRWRWPGGACAWDAFDCIEGVDEDSV